MVLIIDGEIVPDNDPRAVAKRAGSAGPRSSQSGPAPSTASSRSGVGGGAPPPPAAANGAAASPIDAIAAAIGVQGQSVRVPAIASVPSREVPMIHIILLGAATLFFGWRVLAFAAVAHVAHGLSQAGGAAPDRGGTGGRPTR
ncbi:hypothetical protein AB1Y20_004550 [Prymnesium parvum]|uniref:Copper transporter n=1 Tax=Prymnesium parvum TaxID=97485 RepID=A0AB34IWT8_PRYPA